MKAEINNENKAKFFALYWGQEVLMGGGLQSVQEISFPKYYEIDEYHLILTPLSMITDEDAIEVAKRYFEDVFTPGKIFFEDLRSENNRILIDPREVSDYLRSKGYAFPWMGITVHQQVEAGWVKLKQEGDEN